MSSNINLIDKVKTNETKDDKASKLKKISFFLLITIAFLAVAIFLINYKFSVSAVSRDQNNLISQLSVYENIVVKHFILEKRLDDISNILNNRSTYNIIISELTVDLPNNVTIDEFEIDESNLKILISADSLEDISDFLNKLLILSENDSYSNIILEELSIKRSKFVVKIKATKNEI